MLLTPQEPLNVRIMDVDAFIKTNNLQRVQSHSVFEASSSTLAEDGLYSETIFGQIGTPERIATFGYIELNTHILQPVIYKNLLKLSSIYEDIIAGNIYAVFNPVTKDFERVTGDPEDTEGAGTGFTFFMSHFDEIDFAHTGSHIRSDRIDIITKYKDVAFCRRMLVLPAGLRDINTEDGGMSSDDINKLYGSLLSYSLAIPPGSKSPLYDSVRYSIQKKALEIYNHLENLQTGKKGFLQGAYGRRRVALGTRNVITSVSYATATPDHPQALAPDETKIGLFQCMKMLQPLVVHNLRQAVFTPVFGSDTNIVPLTNPETLTLEYRELSQKELARYNTSAAIESWISKFKNSDIRTLPISITDITGKQYYVCMVHDDGEEISLFRSLPDFEKQIGREVLRENVHPLTWLEAFYMVTHRAATGRHVYITRYPVIQDESCYPSKIHIATTTPARVVKLRDALSDTVQHIYPEYPILGNPYNDAVSPFSARLAGLGGQ